MLGVNESAFQRVLASFLGLPTLFMTTELGGDPYKLSIDAARECLLVSLGQHINKITTNLQKPSRTILVYQQQLTL
jgi:hypothetical protein